MSGGIKTSEHFGKTLHSPANYEYGFNSDIDSNIVSTFLFLFYTIIANF